MATPETNKTPGSNGNRSVMYLNLKLQLWRSGIRQNRLAQMIGVHESLLSKIVNGFREPDPEMKARIATILNSDEDWLFSSPTKSDRKQHCDKV